MNAEQHSSVRGRNTREFIQPGKHADKDLRLGGKPAARISARQAFERVESGCANRRGSCAAIACTPRLQTATSGIQRRTHKGSLQVSRSSRWMMGARQNARNGVDKIHEAS
jgi:hypothetical protein